tara:strand:- start:1 stop:951 length:951 start_codon:yes stop_codon:yes gene_type:complete
MSLFEMMARIRAFELLAEERFKAGQIPGILHSSAGHEAIAAGVCAVLAEGDRLTSTHRGHHHMVAFGADVRAMYAELLGRSTGSCGGKGGSMHIAEPEIGLLGGNGLVGGGISHAVGSALTSRMTGDGAVTVSFFGDGAVNGGAFHESLNLAAVWDVPVVFVCENNRWGQFSQTGPLTSASIVKRVRSYGVDAFEIDGWDVSAVLESASHAVETARKESRPTFIEAHCFRMSGHTIGDVEILGGVEYRESSELAEAQTYDPLFYSRTEGHIDSDEADCLMEKANEEMLAIFEAALQDPEPLAEDAICLTARSQVLS